MDKFSYLSGSDIQAIDTLYSQFLNDKNSVDETWQKFFQGYEFARTNYTDKPSISKGSPIVDKEFKVINLINDYRQRGHLFTKTNPVRTRRKYFPTLDIENYGLDKKDLETFFEAGSQIGLGAQKLKDIISVLEQTYCHSIGVQYLFIPQPHIVKWLEQKMESQKNTPNFSSEKKKDIFFHLKSAVGFEKYIHRKFVGQKRFSLEGAESLIPALDAIIEKGAELGISEFVIGMSHRGRLNVLVNIMQKPYNDIFREFVGKEYTEDIELGDVKYHLGYDTEITSDTGVKVKLNLIPNPSHLETSDGLVQGLSRALIDHKYDKNYDKLAPIVIHGDAAIAAQGVVYETIQMSQLNGYKTGGTIHLVVNNQVGFTTNYIDARSSTYCTDIAKVTLSPILHVNGDDVEAVVYAIELAIEYRQKFHTDIFIDILCYRKYGHNEGDEPRFTQPTLYKAIASHPNPMEIYAKQLIEQDVYSEQDVKDAEKDFNDLLDAKFDLASQGDKVRMKLFLSDLWQKYKFADHLDVQNSPETGVAKNELIELAAKINILPDGKKYFDKIVKLFADRQKMMETGTLDWAMGELLAYATLLNAGHPVRISGQDVERGTFSHRHATVVIEDTDQKYIPLKSVSEKFEIYNSLLSEYGVLGFEYGYALAVPDGLTIWEAQFGDFHNVAQVIIDQYISSAEEKWGLKNGLVLLLPHGFEGQGPEHSSARVERFLTLAANNNMQITNCTTPANFFHLLRRQVLRNFRLPLINFSPKSLLRHPKCVSDLVDFTTGKFLEVIDDNDVDVNEVRRLVFCTGKIYYDLLEKKQEFLARDVALVRIEQLHPFPASQIKNILKKYLNTKLTLWVQEEPENMGAWRYIKNEMKNEHLVCVSRMASGSPAIGLHHLHQVQQNEIIYKVFRRCDCELKNIYCGLQCVVGSSREEILKQFNYL